MTPVGPFPRLLLGSGSTGRLDAELATLGVMRPLLVTDRGLERVGAVQVLLRTMQMPAFLDVPENPTVAGADEAVAAYHAGGCDGVVALGGGSVLDTAKLVAALAHAPVGEAAALLGRSDGIPAHVAPLVAIPTTVGTGSESSPVAALHTAPGGPVIGTRGPGMVARVAICDPDLARTLPPRLIAATGIDALSHCVEGFFAEPANPVVDALALDGAARAMRALPAALSGDAAALEELMAAAFAGGCAIHKGLGPAHAVALACADQDLHHGTLIAVALPVTASLVANHAPVKAARLAHTLGLLGADALAPALRELALAAGLPATLAAAGYRLGDRNGLIAAMVASHFNRTSPYAPNAAGYAHILERIAG